MPEKSVQHTCNILPLGTWATIGISVYIGMAVMYAGIFSGLPVLLIVVFMLAAIYGLMYMMTNRATFVIRQNTISRIPDTAKFFFKNAKPRTYTWKDVRSFKSGIDKGRYRGEFQFLEIRFKDGNTWTMTDDYGALKESYNAFLSVFREDVHAFNDEMKRIVSQNPESSHPFSSSSAIPDAIEQKKTFYETFAAKLLTGFFFLVLAGIITFYILHPSYLKAGAIFKIMIVLIPGVAYMAHRTFYSKDRR